ncbi:MAG TPA: phosphatase PAP2 family protein [Actinomycetes bacterium]|nr:phosphatase PAP2 family protein [Actinomycetes bacterium]
MTPGPRGGERFVVVAAVAALALCALAVAVSSTDPLAGEDRLLQRLAVAEGGPWQDLWGAVARLTDLVPLVVVTAAVVLVLLLRRRWWDAADLLLLSAAVWVVNPVLKSAVARPRPDVVDLPSGLSGWSFPAGHAANTMVLVLALLLVANVDGRRLRWAAVVGAAFVLLTAYAQLALERHYPSDLLAGWLLSLALVAGTAAVRQGGPEPSSHPAP